ncbi:MAG TPA: hypothetical protein VII11_09190 [Bacteroidota bacterium]
MDLFSRRVLIVVFLATCALSCDRVVDFPEEVQSDTEVQLADFLYEPRLISPKNGGIITRSSLILLRWSRIAAATSYAVEVGPDSLFSSAAFATEVDTTFARTPSLQGAMFFWRVRSKNNRIDGPWSAVHKFHLRVE